MNRMTKRDISLIKYVEEYGFITVKQAALMFYNKDEVTHIENKYPYDIARRRLRKIQSNGYLQSNKVGNENVYFIDDDYSCPSLHMIITMDVYSKLIYHGAKIVFFKREQPWISGARRSDAYTIFIKNRYYYALAVETLESSSSKRYETPHKQNHKYTMKYREIISSNEHNDIFKNITGLNQDIPLNVLILDNIEHTENWQLDDILTYSDDFEIKNINQIF